MMCVGEAMAVMYVSECVCQMIVCVCVCVCECVCQMIVCVLVRKCKCVFCVGERENVCVYQSNFFFMSVSVNVCVFVSRVCFVCW